MRDKEQQSPSKAPFQPFKITPVFEWNWKASKPLVINQGGTSSSKTYSILQVLILKAISDKEPGVTTIVGQDVPNLKIGAMRDFNSILADSEYVRGWLKDFNHSDKIATLVNGSIIEFKAYMNNEKGVQDAKSGKRKRLFINEANGVDVRVFDQLYMRTTEQTFIDFNPTNRFWAHDIVDQSSAGLRNDVDVFYSNYKHNPYVDSSIVEKLQSYKLFNNDHWLVYGVGKTGQLKGLVFPDAQQVDWPEDAEKIDYGLDFGYNHPTCLIRSTVFNGMLIFDELIYESGMNNKDISDRLSACEVSKSAKIQADSAEPKSIDELRGYGWNVVPAMKGKDSISWGINWIKQQPYGITRRSVNLWKEQRNYTWLLDASGNPLNEPIDKFNHGWDAARYSQSEKLQPTGPVLTWL